MKKWIFPYAVVLGLVAGSCTSTKYVDEKTFSEMIAHNEFTFIAQRAHPMDYASVNRVSASIPGAIPTRILQLDYGYTLTLKKDSVKVNLPYFGRAYTSNYGSVDTGFKIDSSDFILNKKEGKKNAYLYTIEIKDKPNIQRIIVGIFPNGKGVLSIQANDRQPISYDGYIMRNEK